MDRSKFLAALSYSVAELEHCIQDRRRLIVEVAGKNEILVGEERGSANRVLDAILHISEIDEVTPSIVLLIRSYEEAAWEYYHEQSMRASLSGGIPN